MIASILQRNLVRVSENAAKRRHGVFGRFGGTFWRSGTIVFKSEFEEVSISFDEDGHASVHSGAPVRHDLVLEGPHDSFLMMFRDEHNFSGIPESIEVHAAGLESLHGEATERILRDMANKLLRIMFE